MNTLLPGSLVVAVILLAWVSWRHARLRQRLNEYTRIVGKAVENLDSAGALPTDVPDIELLSNEVHNLGKNFQTRLSDLETQRARLEATLTQMTDGVLIVDSQGRIQTANPAAERLFGEGESLNGKSASVALRHHVLIETWQKCQQSRKLQSDSVELAAAKKFLQLIAIPDEHAGGVILLAQDLTRIRRLETVRRDFISNVSHELRTPLASLKALTETLNEGALEDPPAARRFLGRIQTEVDALTQMANELLELSRIESGQVPLDKKLIAPASLLHSAADRMKMQAERGGLSLSIDCAENLPPILADLPRLEQVLVNLIHNAIKFTPPGGEVKLGATADGGAVRFWVSDNGAGIPADDLSRIFERFYRVDRSRSGGGTGLGLSIAKHLVEAHAGRIWAESREGQGSVFYFTIPISQG